MAIKPAHGEAGPLLAIVTGTTLNSASCGSDKDTVCFRGHSDITL